MGTALHPTTVPVINIMKVLGVIKVNNYYSLITTTFQ